MHTEYYNGQVSLYPDFVWTPQLQLELSFEVRQGSLKAALVVYFLFFSGEIHQGQ